MNKKQIVMVTAIIMGSAFSTMAQKPIITGYGSSGQLTFVSTGNNPAFTLEFSGTPNGPWTNWGSVTEQPITGAVMTIPTPMFYRIKETDIGVVSNAALRAYLVSHGFDHNGDGRIDAEEAALVHDLGYMEPTGFQSLDLSPFINLYSLKFLKNNNQLTNIDVSQNTQLASLVIASGPIKHVQLPQTSTLTYVLSYGSLTNIDLAVVPGLKELHADNNALTVLDIHSNTNLTSVTVRGNPLAEIIVWWDTNAASPISLQYDENPVIRNP